MKLDFLVKLYKKLDEINSHVKTFFIVIMIIPIFLFGAKKILDFHQIHLDELRVVEEQHAMGSSSLINSIIAEIQDNVPECSNVMLLTYHNQTNSINGFSYVYLDWLTETSRSIENEILQDYWTNLKYVYYCDELQRIHNTGCFMINNIEDVKFTLPRLYKKFKESDAKAVTVLPLEGIKMPIGMVIIFYKEPQPVRALHTQKISKLLQQLSTLLDREKK